jgi:hypothetical protein
MIFISEEPYLMLLWKYLPELFTVYCHVGIVGVVLEQDCVGADRTNRSELT